MTFDLARLLAAPELLVVDLVDLAVDTLVRALLLEHPSLAAAPPPFRESDICRSARALLRSAAQLRRTLAAYRRAVDRTVVDLDRDLPF